LIHTFGQGQRRVLSVDISKDGAYVAAAPADDDFTAKIWDAHTYELLHTLGGAQGHTALIRKVKISSDNKYVATASEDNTVKIWSLKTGKLLYTFVGHLQKIESLHISPDVRYVVSSSSDHTAKIWSLLLNLNAAEFNEQNNPLAWIKDNITLPQADLIARAFAALRDGTAFVIKPASDDSIVIRSFARMVAIYLLRTLNIKLDL
jgi:WD40 repeat protein